MAILLIGSTGNGKSALGNFLIDPREECIFKRDHQHFKTAQTNLPETKKVSTRDFRSKDRKITVVDTPGLNESDVLDLEHMIEIIETLQKINETLGCIVVVKFNTKIDAQYRATLQYYRKLLPSLFERNVIIVMTDFQTDARSEWIRKKQNINVEKIKENTKKEVMDKGELTYEPMLFAIDCLPNGEEEQKFNLQVREAIISRLVSQQPFRLHRFTVAKTAYIKGIDNEEIKRCEGEIIAFSKRLEQANERATGSLEEILKEEQKITKAMITKICLEQQLHEMDSDDLTDIGTWSVSEEWRYLQWLSRDFEKSTSCDIENVEKWSNGHCEWKDYQQTERSVKGRLEGEFMRGLYASITLQASKRTKYKTSIESCRNRISKLGKEVQRLIDDIEKTCTRHKEYTSDIKHLEQFIEKTREVIKTLVGDYMTLDEARARLHTLLKKGNVNQLPLSTDVKEV